MDGQKHQLGDHGELFLVFYRQPQDATDAQGHHDQTDQRANIGKGIFGRRRAEGDGGGQIENPGQDQQVEKRGELHGEQAQRKRHPIGVVHLLDAASVDLHQRGGQADQRAMDTPITVMDCRRVALDSGLTEVKFRP